MSSSCACAADCWEWFVQLVLKSGPENDANSNFPPKGSKPVETSSLSTAEEEAQPPRRDRMKQLFNRHGFNIAIFPGNHVKGVREAFNPYSVLELIPVGIGEVRIRGVETGSFLAIDVNGVLHGRPNDDSKGDREETVFSEISSGPFLLYLSKKYSHLGWYVGITKDGEAKNGQKTWYPWGQKAVLFVHRSPSLEQHPLKQLRNRHGFTLCIEVDGKVTGTREAFTKQSVLEFSPSQPPGAFRIRGVDSNLFLAMDRQGRLYGEKERLSENNLFTEHAQGGRYFAYLSVRWAHLGWHVGIKKSGKAKKASNTVYPAEQKAIQFEHRFPYPEAPNMIAAGLTAVGEDFPPLAYIDDDLEED